MQGTSECQDAPEGLHANKTAPRKLPIYFQTRKYVTNLYLHGTEVTRSFAAFGGSCAPDVIIGASVSEPHIDEFAAKFLYRSIYMSYVVP